MLGKIFDFISYLFFEMGWLKSIVDLFLIDLIKLNEEMAIYSSLSFFIYDLIKIFILLTVLIYISSYIQTYIDIETAKKTLQKFKGIFANTIGALLGTVTPFCSCSSIPIFIGFTRAGLPIGATFSFLISSPLVDLASIVLIASIFNWQIALVYVVIGLVLAVIGGSIISLLKMDKYVEDFVREGNYNVEEETEKKTFKIRNRVAIDQVKDIIKRVWKYIILGVAIGSIIHGYIPASFIDSVLGENNWYSVPLAVLVGIPMYADIFGTLPIAEALIMKGVGLGTVIAFMMSVTTLSIPSLIMLKKVVKNKLLFTFILIVTVGIILIGYTFNMFL